MRQALIALSDGDARHLLSTLEMLSDDAAPLPNGQRVITYAMVGAVAGRRLIKYDKGGDAYYDLISAFHKSVRGSSPEGALYWYARILEAGGDPLYVARRLLAIATEDIGLADPQAMQVGLNAWDISIIFTPPLLKHARMRASCRPLRYRSICAMRQLSS